MSIVNIVKRWVFYYFSILLISCGILFITDSLRVAMFFTVFFFLTALVREINVMKEEDNKIKKAVSSAKRIKRKKDKSS